MDINQVLNESPALISRASVVAEKLRLKWQYEEEAYNNDEAKFMLRQKAEGIEKTTELKVLVQDDERLYRQRLALVVMESAYRKKEIEVKSLDNEFTSAKMQARLEIAGKMSHIDFNERSK